MRCCVACAPGAPDMPRLIERALLSPRGLDAAEWLFARWPLRAVLDALAARREAAILAIMAEHSREQTAALYAVFGEAPPDPGDRGIYSSAGSERRSDCA